MNQDAQRLGGCGGFGDVGPESRRQAAQPVFEQSLEQLALALEVVVDGALGDAGLLYDLVDRGGGVPMFADEGRGGLEQTLYRVSACAWHVESCRRGWTPARRQRPSSYRAHSVSAGYSLSIVHVRLRCTVSMVQPMASAAKPSRTPAFASTATRSPPEID